jgi:ABC-type lipoprotein release transport system permease subunit
MMEKYLSFLKLGIKYLYRYRRRYYFLAAALIFGFAVVTFITSIKDGMYENVYYSAQAHYAGDIVAVGYNALPDQAGYLHHMGQNEISAILEAAALSGINARYTVQRTLYGDDAVLHFNGTAVQLKTLIGCDWTQEAHLFGKMAFDEEPEALAGDDGIVLSVPVARQLGAKTGDSVIMELQTRFGQKNTGIFIVKGIVQDTSIFAYYKAYISRLSLNRLVIYGDNDCSTIGFFFDDPARAEQKRIQLQKSLSAQHVQTGPLVYDRDGLTRERDRPWEGVRIFLYTLPVYLSEISYLLDVMNTVTHLLYGMMLLIVLVSAAVTYRLILSERAKEIGIMSVIGFSGGDLRMVLWTEIIILGLCSLSLGFVLARIMAWAISFVSFSWFPGFEIFLQNGRLMALYLPGTMLVNTVLLLFILLMLVLIPSLRVARKDLPVLLSGEL